MTVPEELAERFAADYHAKLAAAAGLEQCVVRCRRCGAEREVYGAHCLRHGWPQCCGETMRVGR